MSRIARTEAAWSGGLRARRARGGGTRAVGVLAALVAGACALPMLAVALAALTGGTETLEGLAATLLPRYALTTLILAASVGTASLALGAATAWLVVMTRFPGRRGARDGAGAAAGGSRPTCWPTPTPMCFDHPGRCRRR